MVGPPGQLPDTLLRTLTVVAGTESLAKASRRLGIGEPAVTARIARLEKMLGGPLIETAGNRSVATVLGRMVLQASRRLVQQSLADSAAGAADDTPIRIGVSSLFIEKFASAVGGFASDELRVSSAVCTELVASFMDRRLDVVMALDVLDHRERLGPHIIDEHAIDLMWIKTPDFASDADEPIPLAVWPGDGIAVRTLDSAGTPYRTMFSSNDYFAKLSAVRSGRYISMMPRNTMRAPFVEADDDRLPALPTAHALIAVRGDGQSPRMRNIAAALAAAHMA